MSDLPYAHGGPAWTGTLKAEADDFVVDEVLGFAPTGQGEHAFLHVEKRGANTDWVARALAKAAGVPVAAVGFAGLKDRHAVTRQYFTVHVARKPEPDWTALDDPEWRVLVATRHDRKIKRGALRGNRFAIVLRDVAGDRDAGLAIAQRLGERGVPNYFGEQRFGRGGDNVERALALFAGERDDAPGASPPISPPQISPPQIRPPQIRMGRAERSIVLSAARSAVFNAVLAMRVSAGTWDRAIDGDVFQIDGSGSIFGPEAPDADLLARLAVGRVHPTAPLWGRGTLRTTGDAAALESRVAGDWKEVCAGLESVGLEQERRATRLMPRDFVVDADGDVVRLAFSLPAGSYATVVVRELCATA